MPVEYMKITTCMRGFKKWMDAHPRKNLRGYFSVNGRDMTNAEVRRVVSYAVEKGYETEADIPSEELAQLLNQRRKGNEMTFNSQICTTREQSERLLALGLTKETADMGWGTITLNGEPITFSTEDSWDDVEITEIHIPAWSLHRLIEMIDDECVIQLSNFSISGKVFAKHNNLYDNIVDCIEWLIKEGYFNKEYLEE